MYSATTIDRKFFCLQSFYSRLVRCKIVSENLPSALNYKKTPPRTEAIYLTLEERDTLQNTILLNGGRHTKRDLAIYNLLRRLGFRRKEIIKLQWSDIDFYNRTIVIQERKNGKYAELPMDDILGDSLLQYFLTVQNNLKGYVFTSNKTSHMSETAFKTMFNKYVELSGLQKDFDIVPYSLRHTFCRVLQMNNVHENIINQFMGHTARETHARYYSKLPVNELRKFLPENL